MVEKMTVVSSAIPASLRFPDDTKPSNEPKPNDSLSSSVFLVMLGVVSAVIFAVSWVLRIASLPKSILALLICGKQPDLRSCA
jgi:hypothetical protein